MTNTGNAHTVGSVVNFRDTFGKVMGDQPFPVTVTHVGGTVPGLRHGSRAVTGVDANGRVWWTGCGADGLNRNGEPPFAQQVRR